VLEGRQLALKISANSVYGFTGAQIGQLPCLEISSSVTAFGREMILQTKAMVESLFPKSQVIYGDTDSLMVKFANLGGIADAIAMGKEASSQITAKLAKRFIKLEFEKVYCPYILISKKRYAGLYWTNAVKPDKIDTKGLENVRRDNCPLIRQLIKSVLEKVLLHKDKIGTQQLIKSTVADLLQGKIDVS